MLERLRVKRDDDGFTLVETMVALVVISIVFAALAGFLVTSIKAQATNERRVRGTQVGNQAVEDMRALPWDVLGFYASDDGYEATVDGMETVTLDEPTDGVRDSRVPLPGEQDVVSNGVTYKRSLSILWFDDPGDGLDLADDDADTHDAKLVRAALSWQVGEATKTLTVEGLRAPTVDEVTPRGADVVSPFQVQSFTSSPASMTLDAAGKTKAALTLSLETTIAASQVRLSFVDRDNITQSFLMTAPSSNTSWTYTLPTGTGPFDVGSVQFSARAYAAAGATADGTTNVAFSLSTSTLDISTPTVSPSSIDLDSSGRNTQAVTVTAVATDSVSSMTVSYPTASGTATASMNLSNGGTTGTYTLPASAGTFSSGSVQWTVTATGGSGTASRTTTVTYVPPAITEVAIDALGISPSICAHNGNYILNRASYVYITVSGVTSTDAVKLEFTDGLATKVDASYYSTNTSGSLVFKATLAAGTMKWKNVATPSVTATATRYPDLTQTQRTFSVSVTTTNGSSSCPA